MNLARNIAAAIAVAIATLRPAAATDFTDLWWDPAESGWGLNVAQQADTMYVTLYVYGTTNRAAWYAATDPVSFRRAPGIEMVEVCEKNGNGQRNRRPDPMYTAEFKTDAVKLADEVGITETAKRLDMPISSIHNG